MNNLGALDVNTAALQIQRVFRGQRVRKIFAQYLSVKIMDAKQARLNWNDIKSAVERISKKELEEDQGKVSPWSYIRPEYFSGQDMELESNTPEFIFIATVANKIVGFLISKKKPAPIENDPFMAWLMSSECLPIDTSFISYIAVDSSQKKRGIGTKLMLAAMDRVQLLGKRYLTLEYLSEGYRIDKKRGETKQRFYNSFSQKFGIPTVEKRKTIDSVLRIYPYYDTKDINFKRLLH